MKTRRQKAPGPIPRAALPPTSKEPDWSTVKHLANEARLRSPATYQAAFQILCGFELLALRLTYGVRSGQLAKHGSGRTEKWPAVLEKQLGLKHSTEWRWVEMARAICPRIEASNRVVKEAAILGRSTADWPDAVASDVLETLKALTKDKTQDALLRELGLSCDRTRSTPVNGTGVTQPAASGYRDRSGVTKRALPAGAARRYVSSASSDLDGLSLPEDDAPTITAGDVVAVRLGSVIRTVRACKGLSVAELARRAGVCEATVATAEAGDSHLRVTTLRAIERGLGVRPGWLMHLAK